MALPIKNIILDIWQQPTEILRLVQYESTGREVQFTLTDAGAPFDLTGLTVMLEILKPDGTVVVMPCDVINAAGGVVKSTIVSQAVVVAGVGAAQLRIYKSGQVTKTFSMRVAVTESINSDGIAESTTEFTALQDLIVDVQSWENKIDELDDRVSQIITTPAESVNAEEIIDARDGETALGDRLNRMEQAIEDNYSRGIAIYGCRFEGSNPVGTRTHAAVGLVANVGLDDSIVQNDFDDVPIWQRPRCLVYHDADGRAIVMAYEGEPEFDLEGRVFPPYETKAQVFYEQRPFYWNGSLDWPQVSSTPLEGFELAPMFKNPVDKVYLPSYWMGEDGGKACSLSGTYPTEVSINTGMTSARAYHPRAHLETVGARISEYVLQLIEFATRDVQTIMMGASSNRYSSAADMATIGEDDTNRIVLPNASAATYVVGQTICIGTARNSHNIASRRVITSIEDYDASNKSMYFDGTPLNIPTGAFTSSRAWRNGATDIVRASSGSPGSNTSGRYPCIWRGKVDPWAMAFSALCDVLVKRDGEGTEESPYVYTPFFLPDPTLYAAGAIDSNWLEVSMKLPGVDGYVKQMLIDPKRPAVAMPIELGASNITYMAAYFSYARYVVSAVFVGGYWYYGRYCSPVGFDCDYTPSGSSVYRLARLNVAPL